jgi:SAM-dependent methyltransferase
MSQSKAVLQPEASSLDSSQVYAGPEFERWAKAEGLIPSERFLIEQYLRSDRSTLEAGAGGGRILRALIELGFDYTSGFDNVPALIEEARRQDPSRKTAYSVQDARSLPYVDGEFDQIIYLQQIISFIGDVEGRRRAIAEAYRVLKPDGTALFSFLCYESRLQSIWMRGMIAYLACFRALTFRGRSPERASQLPASEQWPRHFNEGCAGQLKSSADCRRAECFTSCAGNEPNGLIASRCFRNHGQQPSSRLIPQQFHPFQRPIHPTRGCTDE